MNWTVGNCETGKNEDAVALLSEVVCLNSHPLLSVILSSGIFSVLQVFSISENRFLDLFSKVHVAFLFGTDT